jgi:hypothetical protein
LRKSYWELNAESGHYFHRHSDGTVTGTEDDGRDVLFPVLYALIACKAFMYWHLYSRGS